MNSHEFQAAMEWAVEQLKENPGNLSNETRLKIGDLIEEQSQAVREREAELSACREERDELKAEVKKWEAYHTDMDCQAVVALSAERDRYRQALKEINAGRHGFLSSVSMAAIAFAALSPAGKEV